MSSSDSESHIGRGVLLVALAALLWSTGGLGIKGIPDSALKVAFYRSLIAAVVLLAWFRPWRVKVSAPFLVAIASYALCLTTFVIATKWTTAANAIFLQYSGVIWVLLLSPVFLKEPLRGRDIFAIGAALCGMALFFVHDFEARGLAGSLVATLSGLFFAALIMSLRFQRGASAEAAVTWGNVLTSLALLPFVANDLLLTPKSLGVLTFLGVFQIGVAYALFVAGIKYVTATQASLTGMLEPIANPVWVFFFLGERPHALAIAGACIVLAAIAWHTWVAGRGVPVVGT